MTKSNIVGFVIDGVVEILTPSDDANTDFGGFRILRGRWSSEFSSTVRYLVRVNEKSDSDYIESVLSNFTITGESSQGFESQFNSSTNEYYKLVEVDGLDLTAENIGDEVNMGGYMYREILFNIADTKKSGVADFTLSYTEGGDTVAAGTQRILIPGDTDKDGYIGTMDHSLIYNYLKGLRELPEKTAVGGYKFELADLNSDGQIDTLDHAIVYNMFSSYIISN
jgi:hypothetical protein